MRRLLFGLCCLLLSALACARTRPEVIVITATFPPPTVGAADPASIAAPTTVNLPTAEPTVPPPVTPQVAVQSGTDDTYVVQPGDNLTGIALANGVELEALLSANPEIINPDALFVGQEIRLPNVPQQLTPNVPLIPDSRLVRARGSNNFDVIEFVNRQPGFIRTATDEIRDEPFTAAQIVERVAVEYSVDARLLLALLEYRGGWLSNPEPVEAQQIYPLGAGASEFGFDREGLYLQLTWAADRLNRGYYLWRLRGSGVLDFDDGTRLRYAPDLNAATVGLQYMLSRFNSYGVWQLDISPDGFQRTYVSYFGDPFADAVEPLVPANLTQPQLALPFANGQTWYYTGGPHGGWGSGSAWAALDFAPPDDRSDTDPSCYISNYFARAVASGVIARVGEGTVYLDLDSDGDETTGWVILYLHVASRDRVAEGTQVQVGDPIGRPSCEGGFSNGTHLHLARLYNGEWIPADCSTCTDGRERPVFVLGGWTAVGLPGQEYQGYLAQGNERRVAEQLRNVADNLVAWQTVE